MNLDIQSFSKMLVSDRIARLIRERAFRRKLRTMIDHFEKQVEIVTRAWLLVNSTEKLQDFRPNQIVDNVGMVATLVLNGEHETIYCLVSVAITTEITEQINWQEVNSL